MPFLMGGCLPSEEEAGSWILFASPVAVLGGLVVLWLLYRLWSRRYPEISFSKLPGLLLAVALFNGAVVKAILKPELLDGWWTGIVIFGTSYLTVLLVVWRIWFWRRPRTSFTWVSMPVVGVYVSPAVYLAYEGSSTVEVPDPLLAAWMWPGIMGWVPGGVLLLLLIEAKVRTRVKFTPSVPRGREDLAPNPLAEERWPG